VPSIERGREVGQILGISTSHPGEDCSVDATYVGSGAAGVFFRAFVRIRHLDLLMADYA